MNEKCKLKEVIDLIHRYRPLRDVTITIDWRKKYLIRVPVFGEWHYLMDMVKSLEDIGCLPDRIILTDCYPLLQFVLEEDDENEQA